MLALTIFVVVGVNIGAFSVMATQRHATLVHSDRDIRNLAALLSKQTDRSFQTVDIVHRNIIGRLAGFGLNDRFALEIAGKERFVHDMLVRDTAAVNFVTWISLVDDKGRIVSTSRSFPAPKFDLSQRDYFKALSKDDGLETFVSEPILNRDDDRSNIYVARRISDPQGHFVGILIAGIDTGYFQKLYRDIDVEAVDNILLMRDDGKILSSREPGDLGRIADIAGALRYRESFILRDPGTVRTYGEIEDDDGTVVAQLEAYPAMVVVRNNPSVVLETWRGELVLVVVMVLAVDLSVLVAVLLGLNLMRQERKMRDAERHSARHDILTGLPNRIHFQETLDGALARVETVRFGLVLIDLDNFKEVNDGQGHQAGDELLKLVAARLGACIDAGDVLARLGGDEFAIIKRDIAGRCDLERLAEAALAAFKAPFPIRDRQVSVGASIGIALGNTDKDAALLFDHADMALYQAKALGRGTIRFFSPELQAEKVERKTLAQDLDEAVREEKLELHFQPVVDLSTCRLAGYEALLRWNDPVRGAVPPATFIPIAEETGAIGPLGRWVLREACRQAVAWPSHLTVAVNLSPAQIQLCDVAGEVESALADSGLSPSRLEIEITETVLLDQPAAAKTLHRLVALGVSISLDDFGTGYSSLSYLRSFPFRRIKIDRSFVAEMIHNREAAAIVQTVRDLAGRLGTVVTAEGIETHAQLRMLQAMGCDAGQGYLISRPMPAAEVARFTETFSAGSPFAPGQEVEAAPRSNRHVA
ncbi:hypothetical protein ASG43_03065 [Aureimonas sp. Leaf454]|nr:hypothetical protein ASG43_03065 [Aureimonas sp. Leaf454]